jgi:ATP-binding cassette subfamily F protein 3
LEARLADPAIYQDASKEALDSMLRDQAYIGKELVLLEGEWLEKLEALEEPAK